MTLAKFIRIGAATAGALAMAAQVNAADLYAPAGMKDTPYVVAPTWTGFYIGANVGGGWSQLDSSLNLFNVVTINNTNEANGVVGGGQIGYNWQTGGFVIGVEADFDGFGLSHTRDLVTIPALSFGLGTKVESGFGIDATGRLGYAAGPALFYAKGGYAYFDGKVGIDAPSPLNVRKSGIDGWTIGGGIEYKLSPSWSVKGEYQYYDFGSTTLDPLAAVGIIGGPTIHSDLNVNTVKVGVNYFLGGYGGYAPLK